MTAPIPAAARRAAEKSIRNFVGQDYKPLGLSQAVEIIARETHLRETVEVLRTITREPSSLASGGRDSSGNWVVRLTAAEFDAARDLLAKLES